MDAAAELGRNPVSKHHIQPEYGDEQADAGRDCPTRLLLNVRPYKHKESRGIDCVILISQAVPCTQSAESHNFLKDNTGNNQKRCRVCVTTVFLTLHSIKHRLSQSMTTSEPFISIE